MPYSFGRLFHRFTEGSLTAESLPENPVGRLVPGR